MKIFIWKDVEKVSESYHSGGGLVVIAESIDRAKHLSRETGYIQDPLPTPDMIMALHPMHRNDPEQLIVFPDAGCC